MNLSVRSYANEDAHHLGQVMHRSVHIGARFKYSADQVKAWCPKMPGGPDWKSRLSKAETVVAEREGERIGFMTMDDTGYIDLAFVVPEEMGRGTSDAIYAVLESRARAKGVERLTTQASLLAEPFFEKFGWKVSSRQEIERNGFALENAWMEKFLV